eukprot:30964-Pelagococcus_subviridis.AAC.2
MTCSSVVPVKRHIVPLRPMVEKAEVCLLTPSGQVSPRVFEKAVKVSIGKIEHALEPEDVFRLRLPCVLLVPLVRTPREVERGRQRKQNFGRLTPHRVHLRESDARSDVRHVREHHARELLVHVERRVHLRVRRDRRFRGGELLLFAPEFRPRGFAPFFEFADARFEAAAARRFERGRISLKALRKAVHDTLGRSRACGGAGGSGAGRVVKRKWPRGRVVPPQRHAAT